MLTHVRSKSYLTKHRNNLILSGLLLVLSFTILTNGWGQTVTIGTGTSTQRYPLGNYYGYERSASLYTSAELTAVNGNLINKLAWYIAATTNTYSTPTKIYLKNIGAGTMAASTWANMISGATLVYDATIPTVAPANNWFAITLSQDFPYYGGNLLVLVERNYGGGGIGGSAAPTVRYSTSANNHQYWQQDNSAPTGNGTLTANRPNIQISYYLPNYSAQVLSVNYGTNDWCIGETRNVSVTLKNTGSRTWYKTGVISPCSATNLEVALAIKWNGDPWFDSYGPLSRFPLPNDVAPGGTVTVTLTNVPSPNGNPVGPNNLSINLIARECQWFVNPPGTAWTSPAININPLPTVSAGAPIAIGCGNNGVLNGGITPLLLNGSNTFSYSGSGYDCDNFLIGGITSGMPANATITSINFIGTIGAYCSSWYEFDLIVNNSYIGSGCDGSYIYNGLNGQLANGQKLQLRSWDNDSWCDLVTMTVTFTVNYSYTQSPTVSWSGGPIVSGANTLTPTVNPSVTTTYTVTATTPAGCTATNSVLVTVNPNVPAQPTAIETVPATACNGQVTLSAQYPKPVAEYPFNGNLNDISGNGLNLTVTGGAVAYSDGGLYFNGSGGGNQQFSSPPNTFFSNNTYYTIEFDYLPKVNNGAFWRKIFTWDPSGGDRAPGIFTYNPNIGFHWRHNSDAQPSANAGIDDGTFTLGQWYHVVGVRKGTTFQFYVDGVLRQTATLPADNRNGSAPFVFGAFGGNAAPDGTVIKNFKIYDQAIEWYSGSCTGTFISSDMNITVNPATTTTYYLKTMTRCGTSTCDPIIVSRNPYPAVPTVSASNPNFCAPGTTSLIAQGMAPSGKMAVGNNTAAATITGTDYSSNTNNHTVEFWVKPNRTIVLHNEVTSGISGNLGAPTTEYCFAIFPANGGPALAGTGVSVGTNGIEVIQHANSYFPVVLSYPMTISDWTHIAIVHTNGKPTLYVNGHRVRIGQTGALTTFPSSSVGQGYGYFSGQIDNIRVWSSSRTQTEILNNMYLATPVSLTGLLNNLPLDGNGTASTGANATIGSSITWADPNYYTYTWSGGPQLPLASVNETQTTGSLTNANAGTHNYKVIANVGSCNGTNSANVTVQVDGKPVLPTSLTADYNGVYNCNGRTITLTESGGVLYGTAQYIYGTTSGGSQVAGPTTSTTATHTPTANSTNYYVGTTANGACLAQNSAAMLTYNLPAKGTALSVNENATCYISGNTPIHFYNTSSTNYIGSINPNGRTGIVTMTSYIHSFGSNAGVDDGTMYACPYFGNENFRTAFMGRSFTIVPTGAISGSGNMLVYFPFTNTEYNNLQTASLSKTPVNINDDVYALTDLVVTKHHNPGTENGSPYDNCAAGSSTVITQTSSNNTLNYGITPAITANYANFNVSTFSEFYLHGSSNNSPLPIKLTDFSGNCEKDGVHLTWTTATEINTDHFEILRSRDAEIWELVATVGAAGNSSAANTYQTVDHNGFDTYYYQLRAVDYDGTSETFTPISVNCNIANVTWSIHPVPVTTNATITINATSQSVGTLVITDINGRVVGQHTVKINEGSNSYELDMRRLSEGSYFIRLAGSTAYKPLKFIKIN